MSGHAKRTAWIVTFLSVTGVAIGLELWAALDNSENTVPWTTLILQYVPHEITTTAIAVLGAWLPVHFASRYQRRRGEPASAKRKHWTMVAVAGLIALQAAVTDDRVSGAEWSEIGLAVVGALGVWAVPNTTKRPAPAHRAPRGRPPADAERHHTSRRDDEAVRSGQQSAPVKPEPPARPAEAPRTPPS